MSSFNLKHYIGVTGVSNLRECAQTIETSKLQGPQLLASHSLMTGFLVSPSTVVNAKPVNTDKPFRHVDSLEELIACLNYANSNSVIGMAHFELASKGRNLDRNDPKHVVALLQRLRSAELVPAVQLNGVLSADGIHHIAKETGAPLVFQLRAEHAERGEREVFDLLERLQGVVSKILLDPSAGTGKAINVEDAVRLQKLIELTFPGSFDYGYAGGFGPDSDRTPDTLRAIRNSLGNSSFSIDAESRIRTATAEAGNADGLDQLKLAEYLRTAFRELKIS